MLLPSLSLDIIRNEGVFHDTHEARMAVLSINCENCTIMRRVEYIGGLFLSVVCWKCELGISIGLDL